MGISRTIETISHVGTRYKLTRAGYLYVGGQRLGKVADVDAAASTLRSGNMGTVALEDGTRRFVAGR